MNFTSCLNPQTVERYGETHVVPCGHCVYCRFIKNLSMTERLRLEAQHHKYCVFGTLTYADMFCPRLSFNGRYLYVSDETPDECLVGHDSGLCIDSKYFDKRDYNTIFHLLKIKGFIPRLRKKDAQDFIKRLRTNIFRHTFNYEKEQNFTYALCGEYGPSSFRCHFHFLCFFDDFRIARDFKSLLLESWTFGSARFRFVSDERAFGYVARYVDSFSSLPHFYHSKEICPFLLVSKANPIGCAAATEKEIQKSFNKCSPTISIYDGKKGANTDVLLWSFLEARLYPRFTGFDHVPNWARIRLFRFVEKARSFDHFLSLVHDLFECHDISFLHDNLKNSFLYDYLYTVTHSTIKDSRGYNKLIGVYYPLKRLEARINLTKLSVSEYFHKIDTYYKNKALFMLKNQLQFENDVMCEEPDNFYLIFDASQELKRDTSRFRFALSNIEHSIEHSTKNKAKTDYINSHPNLMPLHSFDDLEEGMANF